MNPRKGPDYEAFGRDVLPGLCAVLAVIMALFGCLIIAYRVTIVGEVMPWGASPNRPPYSATPPA